MDLRDGKYISPSTPAAQAFFDKNTPTTAEVVFDPDIPATADTLYVSSTNGSTWIYQGGAYVTYTAPTVNNTEWYIKGTTIDAGGNKTSSIQRSGSVTIDGTLANSWGQYIYNRATTGSNGLYVYIDGTTSGIPLRVDKGASVYFQIANNGTISTKNYTLPLADGTVDQVIKTNGSGVTSWSTISDATITTTDITTNNFTTSKHGFVPKGTNVGNYLKDDGTWSTISAGGLTYFTEAQSTASPNATVNVDSLTAVASTTNADFVIKPKGTGSILASIPDDTTTGGTKRGIGVVDLQMKRNNATNVATANYSVIAGGQSNQITAGDNNSIGGGYGNIITTGSYGAIVGGYGNTCVGGSTIGGESNTTTGNYHALFGQNNTSSGGGNFAVGISHILSGFYSGVTGRQNTISAYDTFTAGYLHTNNGQGSAVFGARGSANSTMTKLVIATKGFVAGGSQASRFVSGARTTSATPTILVAFFEDDATSQSYNQLLLANNSSVRFKGTIIGRQSGSTNTSAWDIDGIIQRGTTAGSTTLLISNINVVQNTPAWGTPTLAANTSLGCLTVNVTGAATTNIQWTCSLDTTEVIYA